MTGRQTRVSFPALVVTDLDGTFLSDDKSVPKANIRAVKALEERGIPLVFCTGRPTSFVEKYVRLAGAHPLVIGGNGAAICNIRSGEQVFWRCFPQETQRRLLQFCLNHELDTLAYRPDGGVRFSHNSIRVQVYIDYNASVQGSSIPEVPLLPLEELKANLAAEELYKILVTSHQDTGLQQVAGFVKSLPDVYAVSSMAGTLDMMPHGVSKGNAVQQIADIFGIPMDLVGVVGDNQNDIPMFQVAGRSVCMANGNHEAKQFANWVTTRSNNEAGFAQAVEWLLGE